MVSDFKNKVHWTHYAFLLIVSVLFMFIAPFSTSPLYNNFGSDSAIFMLIGRSILSGKIPYIDIFDHKGPIIFFIQALGQSIYPGRMGIWIIEIICCFISLAIIYKLSLLFMKGKIALAAPAVYLFFIALTLGEGNLTEEYSLPLCLVCVYLATKYILSEKAEHPPAYCFLYGICFMTVVFIRANNAAAIIGVVLIIFLNLILKKKVGALLINLAAFILGSLIVLGPVAVYFAMHNALGEMLKAAFIYNFNYALSKVSVKTIRQFTTYQIQAVFPTVTGLMGAALFWSKRRKLLLPAMLLGISVLTYISVGLGQCFKHYLMLSSIPFVLGLILIISNIGFTNIRKTITSVLCIFVALCTLVVYTKEFGIPYFSILRSQYRSTYSDNAVLLASVIPDNEKESVSGYNTNSSWFMATGINPCTRYFTLQDWMAIFDPAIKKEVEQVLLQSPPKWMVVSNFSDIKNENVKLILEEKYAKISEVVDDGVTIGLYRGAD